MFEGIPQDILWLESVWLVALGAIAGTLGSIIGLGGGIIVMPVLTFMGVAPPVAAANSLFTACGNAAASSVSYWHQNRIEYRTGLYLGLASVPGTIAGALLVSDVASYEFRILFGIMLFASGAYMFLRRRLDAGGKKAGMAAFAGVMGASVFAGVISSFFGIGGGIIFVPLMIIILGISMKRAAPTSQLILLFASFSGIITHVILGHPELVHAAFLAVGGAAGGMIGARISIRIHEGSLRIIAAIALVATAVKMVADSILE